MIGCYDLLIPFSKKKCSKPQLAQLLDRKFFSNVKIGYAYLPAIARFARSNYTPNPCVFIPAAAQSIQTFIGGICCISRHIAGKLRQTGTTATPARLCTCHNDLYLSELVPVKIWRGRYRWKARRMKLLLLNAENAEFCINFPSCWKGKIRIKLLLP